MKKSERENWQQEMFSLIRKWQKSGINQKDFCDQHDLTLHAFYYWLRKYRQIYPPGKNGFIPVEIGPVDDSIPVNGEIRIHYPNGVELSLSESSNISRIKALIKAF